MPDILVLSIIIAFACGVLFSLMFFLAHQDRVLRWLLDKYTDSEVIDILVKEGFTREEAERLLNRIKAMGEKREVMP